MNNRLSCRSAHQVIIVFFLPLLATANPIPSGSQLTIVAPVTITSPGTYVLANDISGSIVINANDVILDLNNRTIEASGATGVSINAQRVTVKNGFINNCQNGVQCDGANNVTIEQCNIANATNNNVNCINNTTHVTLDNAAIENAGANNVLCDGSNNVIIKNCNFTGSVGPSSVGFINNCNTITIENCLIANANSEGISATGGSTYRIDNCQIFSPGHEGILISSANGITIQNTHVTASLRENITISSSNNINVENVITQNCPSDGLVLQTNTDESVLKNVMASNNGKIGIRIVGGDNHNIAFCTALNNNNNGIETRFATGIKINQCTAINNDPSGIAVLDSSEVEIYKCSAIENANVGITIPSPATSISVFSNRSQGNSMGNYDGVDTDTIVQFDSAMGSLTQATDTTPFDNLSVTG